MMNIFLIVIILCLIIITVMRDRFLLKKLKETEENIYGQNNSIQNCLTKNIDSLKNDLNDQISSLNGKISQVSSLSEDIKKTNKKKLTEQTNILIDKLSKNIHSLKNDLNDQISSLNGKFSQVSSLSYWNMVSSVGKDIKQINKDDLAEQTNILIDRLTENINKTENLKKDLFGDI